MAFLKAKLGLLLAVLLLGAGAQAQSLKLGSGVKVNPGVRFQRAVLSAQTPALVQPVAAGTSSATFTAANTAHNLIVAVVSWYDVTRNLTGITDSAGNSYAAAAPQASGTLLRQAIWYAKDIAAHAAGNVVTAAWSGTPTAPQVEIMEFSGLDRTAPLDVYASGSGTAASGSPVLVSTAAASTTSANELLLGAGISSYDFSATGTDFSPLRLVPGYVVEYRNVSSAGSYAADAWSNGQAQNWLLQLATFKAAGQTVIIPTPSVTAISPLRGPTNAPTPVTISGTDFHDSATVTIGGAGCTAVSVVSSTSLTCTAPAAPHGVVDVTVTNPGSNPGTLPAAFTYGVYETAAINPPGGGTVSGANGAISCPGACSALVDNGAALTLTAAAGTGYVLNSTTPWTNCDSPAGATCNLTMGAADYTTTANFTAVTTYLMTVSRPVGGTVAETSPNSNQIYCPPSGGTCAYAYPAGTQLVLQATPASGYSFKDWKDSLGHSTCDIANGDTCTLNVGTAAWTVVANFTANTASADYYVSTSGNDSNSGTSLAAAWKTIQHAADTASTGKTILVTAGTYPERVTISRSGLTFTGEKSGDAFLTIVDPTSCYSPACGGPSNFWILSGLGGNVYEHDFGGTQDVNNLLYGPNRRVLWRIANNRWGVSSEGAQWVLTRGSAATYTASDLNCTLPFWNGIEAAFAVSNGTTYIRFKDGTNPNTVALYGEARATSYDSATTGVIHITASSTVKNLWVRGGRTQISVAASNVSVLNNKIEGPVGIRVTGATNTLIDGNDISVNGYVLSGDFDYSASSDYNGGGPWECVPTSSPTKGRRCMQSYLWSPVIKHWGGIGNAIGDYIGVFDGGGNASSTVTNNRFHHIGEAVYLGTVASGSSNWQIWGNRFEYSPMDVVWIQNYATNVYVHDNTFAHVNIPVRFQGIGDSSDNIYFYKNRAWDTGEAFYFWADLGTPAATNHLYIYNNSFAAGSTYNERVLNWSGNVASTANFHFFNNLASAGPLAVQWGTTNNIPGTASEFGRYGYNWLGGNHGTTSTVPAWTPKTGNITKPAGTWAWGTPSLTTEPAWATPSDAVGKGVDCSATFTLGSTTFTGGLPGCVAGQKNMGAQQ